MKAVGQRAGGNAGAGRGRVFADDRQRRPGGAGADPRHRKAAGVDADAAVAVAEGQYRLLVGQIGTVRRWRDAHQHRRDAVGVGRQRLRRVAEIALLQPLAAASDAQQALAPGHPDTAPGRLGRQRENLALAAQAVGPEAHAGRGIEVEQCLLAGGPELAAAGTGEVVQILNALLHLQRAAVGGIAAQLVLERHPQRAAALIQADGGDLGVAGQRDAPDQRAVGPQHPQRLAGGDPESFASRVHGQPGQRMRQLQAAPQPALGVEPVQALAKAEPDIAAAGAGRQRYPRVVVVLIVLAVGVVVVVVRHRHGDPLLAGEVVRPQPALAVAPD